MIEYDAPGGCFGAVEITAARVPPAAIPGFTLPDAEVNGQTAEGETVPGDSAEGGVVEGSSTPQVCQQLPKEGSRTIESVTRPSVTRESAGRDSLNRPSANRESLNVDGDFLPPAFVPAAFVPSVFVPSVFVASEFLESILLPNSDTEVFSNDQESSYFASADVLFDFGQAVVKPEAADTLAAIADDLKANFPTGTIQVDGHTDSIDDDAFNQTLSEQRAEAVKQWLVTQGGIPAERIVPGLRRDDAGGAQHQPRRLGQPGRPGREPPGGHHRRPGVKGKEGTPVRGTGRWPPARCCGRPRAPWRSPC